MLLRMHALPKAEYEGMKYLLQEYGFSEHSLQGPSELFAALIRLGLEVERFSPPMGEKWLIRIIQETRSNSK